MMLPCSPSGPADEAAVLHDEVYSLQRPDVLARVGRRGDNIGSHAWSDGPSLGVHTQEPSRVDRHGLKNGLGTHPSGLIAVHPGNGEGATVVAGEIVNSIAAERNRNPYPHTRTQSIELLFVLVRGPERVAELPKHPLGERGEHGHDSIFPSKLEVFVTDPVQVLERGDTG